MTNVILDCDPGIDDALAMVFALGIQELNVVAITTVSGNRPVNQTFENARNILALAQHSHIPVYQGAYSPLDQSTPRSNLVHGEDGLGGIELADSTAPVESMPAALKILDVLEKEAAGTVTIVAIGPLTNLALAFALAPDTFHRTKQIAIMGGSVNVAGNVTPAAEFNFWADPLAADRVLQSGVQIELFGLDVTTQAICTNDWLSAVENLPGPAAKALAVMVAHYFREDPLLHDPCPVAWLVEPDLFSATPMHLRVDTSGGIGKGNTVGWLPARDDCPGPVNANVHVHVNCDALLSLMLERLRALGGNGAAV